MRNLPIIGNILNKPAVREVNIKYQIIISMIYLSI